MNINFNCKAMNARIGIENENIFNEKFWQRQNYIINAVDNIDARIYISEQSLIYKKILRTIANSQVIIPNKTINYTRPLNENIEQEAIVMCTLRNFPTLITHCIEWARDNFDGYFVKILQDLKKFCINKENFYKELEKNDNVDFQIQYLGKIIQYSKLLLSKNYDDCLEIAFNEYIKRFNNDIIQILSDNPPDSVNEDGSKFWSSNKRLPIPLPFDSRNDLIILYIKKYADILSKALSIQMNNDIEYIKKKCNSFIIKEFIPTKKPDKNKNRYQNTKDDDETIEEKKIKKRKRREEIEKILKIQNDNLNTVKDIANKFDFPYDIANNIKIREFEKDDDTNEHIEFLYAASNLRANNFRIKNCDIYKVKMISGKITPAIATTTACIVGLVSLQLYTLMQSEDIDYLRECSFNLAFNNYMNTAPTQCEFIKNIDNSENVKYVPDEFTIWDFIEVKESMTIKQFINGNNI